MTSYPRDLDPADVDAYEEAHADWQDERADEARAEMAAIMEDWHTFDAAVRWTEDAYERHLDRIDPLMTGVDAGKSLDIPRGSWDNADQSDLPF